MMSWELPIIAVLIRMHCSSESYPISGMSPVGYILLVIVFIQKLLKKKKTLKVIDQNSNPN